MRRLFILFFMLCLIITGCSGNDSSGPSDNDHDNLLASATIGSEGGTLSSDDISIEIPSGSLDMATELNLYLSGSGEPFAEQGVSPLFRLEGLPQGFDGNLHIAIRYDGVLNAESFIAMGEEFYLVEDDDSGSVYSLFQAADSSGFLLGDIPVISPDARTHGKLNAVSDGAGLIIYLLGVSDYLTLQDGDFRIRYPRILQENAEQLKLFLDQALNTIEYMQFQIPDENTTLPINVLIREKSLGSFAQYIPREAHSYYTDNQYTSIEVREQDMGTADYPEMKLDIGNELYLLVAAMHNRSTLDRLPLSWFDYAGSTWFQCFMSADPDTFVPDLYLENSTCLLDSFDMRPAAPEYQHLLHGRGMGAFIKFMYSRFGPSVLPYIYVERKEHEISAWRTIFGNYVTVINQPHAQWYPAFIKQLINEEIYDLGGQLSSRLLDKTYHEYDIDSDANQNATFPFGATALESKIFKFGLNNPDFADGDQLQITVYDKSMLADSMHLIVFKRKGTAVEYIGDGSSVIVDSILGLQQDGWDIFAVAVNSIAGSLNDATEYDYYLNIEVKEAPSINIARVVINVIVDAYFRDSGDTSYLKPDFNLYWV
ncbi:MAG TPA: hypothetical protein ENO07_02850, partial [candidate division Zixibacteria bacterium]|nr:hypothetical protein [candidate division Zixibacteria bacterium]